MERTFGFSSCDFSSTLFADVPVFYGLEGCLLEELEQNLKKNQESAIFSYLQEREVVICQEMGCGLLSMDERERRQQEAVARLCCRLTEVASAVYRVQMGLGMQIK